MEKAWFGSQHYKSSINVQSGVILPCKGSLRYVKVQNKSNQLMYFQIYDSATAPSTGATPLRSWSIDPAVITKYGKLEFTEDFLSGLPPFRFGIGFSFSTTESTFTPMGGSYPMSLEANYSVGMPMVFDPAKHGINYGHQVGPYDFSAGGQIEKDFDLICDAGIEWVRIGMPPFDYSGMQMAKDLVVYAKSRGRKVIWGTTATNGPPVTLTRWNNFLASIPATAAWAASVGVDRYTQGNEEGLHNDKTTLTNAQVVTDMTNAYASTKAAFNNGHVNMSISAGEFSLWPTGGPFDSVGLNKYDFIPNFLSGMLNAATAWGSKFTCTEYNIDNGLFHNNILGSEEAQAYDLMQRRHTLDATGCTLSFLFCFRDGGGGVTANSFSIMSTDNRLRKVWKMFIDR